jgi:peroxiredoxin
MADHSQFEKLNIQLLAISANHPFSQKMFAGSLGLAYPLLSDHPDLTVIQRYDILKRIGKAQQPVAQGAYFLIDKQGIIQGKWMNPPGEVFPNETILHAAHELLN